MALGLLCLGLSLLRTLQSQAQDTTPTLIPSPPLSKVPLQPDFQDDQFQGKWYLIGLAGNAFRKGGQSQYNMHRTIYKLNDDHSYNVTSALLRGQNCDVQIRIFVPSVQPGQFTLGYMPPKSTWKGVGLPALLYRCRPAGRSPCWLMEGHGDSAFFATRAGMTLTVHAAEYLPAQSYTVRVVATNYTQFAMVFFERKYGNRVNFRTTLYGRTKELSPAVRRSFVNFAESLGLTGDNIIFPVPTERCIDD
ncbi:neutrophil gelatinase-associated lipocalin [Fukomys damarensis]|uniref:neutrophil gelatinase-associated lipocalin n=1 Tax=Fukomys damarensis TaxID=885580 RepID=UPI001455B9B2|nr:neutrophil gelatinase-associated lipocalin [Fukomys damarensis]